MTAYATNHAVKLLGPHVGWDRYFSHRRGLTPKSKRQRGNNRSRPTENPNSVRNFDFNSKTVFEKLSQRIRRTHFTLKGHFMASTNPECLYQDIHSNYSDVGATVIQTLFGEGYLSPCGAHATDQLVALAAPQSTSRVLDVGSGLGGSAMRLAEQIGCRVTGLELVNSSMQSARKAARARELDHLVSFELGDATHMPFDDAVFSMLWSQDAWCHIDERDALMSECARVLEPGGSIVFADWLLTGSDNLTYRQDVLPAIACPNLQTLSGYVRLLERHGFTDIQSEDHSETYTQHYRQAMKRLKKSEGFITETFGAKVFSIVLDKNTFALQAFESGQIGGGYFFARLPG